MKKLLLLLVTGTCFGQPLQVVPPVPYGYTNYITEPFAVPQYDTNLVNTNFYFLTNSSDIVGTNGVYGISGTNISGGTNIALAWTFPSNPEFAHSALGPLYLCVQYSTNDTVIPIPPSCKAGQDTNMVYIVCNDGPGRTYDTWSGPGTWVNITNFGSALYISNWPTSYTFTNSVGASNIVAYRLVSVIQNLGTTNSWQMAWTPLIGFPAFHLSAIATPTNNYLTWDAPLNTNEFPILKFTIDRTFDVPATTNSNWSLNLSGDLSPDTRSWATTNAGGSYTASFRLTGYLTNGTPFYYNVAFVSLPQPGDAAGVADIRSTGGKVTCNATTVDPSGNIFVVGDLTSSGAPQGVNFNWVQGDPNATSVTIPAGKYLFVAKYNAQTILQWGYGSPVTSDGTFTGVTCDSFGNVYASGYFSGTAQFGLGAVTATGAQDAILVEYAGNSSPIRQKVLTGGTGKHVNGGPVVIGPSGNIVQVLNYNDVGTSGATIDCGNGVVLSAQAGALKMNNSFVATWGKELMNALGHPTIYDVALDSSENVFLCGQGDVGAAIGPVQTNQGSLFWSLAPDGSFSNNVSFGVQFGSQGLSYARGITVDPYTGYPAGVGYYQTTNGFNSGCGVVGLTNSLTNGISSAYWASFTPTFGCVTNMMLGTGGTGLDIKADYARSLTAILQAGGLIDFSGDSDFQQYRSLTLFVANYTTNGVLNWVTPQTLTTVTNLAVGWPNSVYANYGSVCGVFKGVGTFGSRVITSPETQDGYVYKLRIR